MAEVNEIDFDAHYRIDGYHDGVSWYLIDYVKTLALDPDTGEPIINWLGDLPDAYDVDKSRVVAVMVGDDRKQEIDVEDLIKINETDFCRECGQIGCGHNVYE